MSVEHVRANVRHIPYRRLGTIEVQLRYCEDDPEIRQFLGSRPRNGADLLRRAPLNARRLVDRRDLSVSFTDYAERHGAPQEVLDSARAVASDDTFFVITGQQPGLFGGPLYSVHKAATAVRLARELSELPDAPRVVPVFWNHSDDHDLDEVNRAFLPNSSQEVQRVRLDLPAASGEPIRSIRVGRAMESALAEVATLLPDSDFLESVMDVFRPRHADEHFGDAMARLLFSLFGEDGLLVIEPRDLPASAFEVLPRWCEMSDSIRDRIGGVTEHLTDIGLDVTMDPTATLMFEMAGDRRVPLAASEPFRRAQDLSPGVLLRPLWQDACLPTIGFVVGPGELSYLAIAGPLYKTLGVPQPVFVPRASMTLVEPSIGRVLNRCGLDIPDLTRDPAEIAAELDDGSEGTVEEALNSLGDQIDSELKRIAALVADSDPQLVAPASRTQSKIAEELTKLTKKLRKAREQRVGTGLLQVRKLVANLRPRGRLQERVLPILPFMVRHGTSISRSILDAADPFCIDHGVVEL
ncbi:MAG: bacillithiol biosynthesis BshC [Planctomycetes bacterium]|nr:bacillithiol biosynthesis BshC [Planctomycetota bacterium]